jgi:hypothetical protein
MNFKTIKTLIEVANELDRRGLVKEADALESVLQNEKASILLYHGTRTMPDMSNVESFREGVSSGKTQWEGRSGFFVYTNREITERRLKSSKAVKDDLADFYREIWPEEDGYPMLVTLEVSEIEPKDWDIDMEIQHKDVVQGLIDNIDLWRPLQVDRVLPQYNPFVSTSLSKSWNGKATLSMSKATASSGEIQFPIDYTLLDGSSGTEIITYSAKDSGIIHSGETLGIIVKVIEREAIEVIHKIEKEIFVKALTKPTAIKYMGAKTLPVKKLEALIDNKWVDVTSQNPPPPEEGLADNPDEKSKIEETFTEELRKWKLENDPGSGGPDSF